MGGNIACLFLLSCSQSKRKVSSDLEKRQGGRGKESVTPGGWSVWKDVGCRQRRPKAPSSVLYNSGSRLMAAGK